METKEVVFIGALAGGMLLVPAVLGVWSLFSITATFFICFGLWEWYWSSFHKDKMTVSQHIWALPAWKKWTVIGSMIAAWAALMIHFAG